MAKTTPKRGPKQSGRTCTLRRKHNSRSSMEHAFIKAAPSLGAGSGAENAAIQNVQETGTKYGSERRNGSKLASEGRYKHVATFW